MKTKILIVALCLLLTLSVSPATSALAARSQASVPPNIKLTPILSGLNQPIFATHAGDGSGRLFIAQRGGQILILDGTTLNSTPFLDVNSIIKTDGGEQGLLGLAFDPDYPTNGYFYIAYINQASVGDTVLARYQVSNGDPDVADFSSAEILLTIPQPEDNHNGGMIAFGADGYLYMGVGDGGGGGDNHGTIGNGQDKTTLLGKILRLDVSTVPYTVPTSNPFYSSPTDKKEIWAYGVRNPWRFSFDKTTGDLYMGDVGQNAQEEINFQGVSATGGANYGWRIREGSLCYNPSTGCVSPPGYVAPAAVYNHSAGCSVTGGYVYRGTAFPGLVGVYLYGDFCTGKLWGLYKNGSNQWTTKLIKSTNYNISSFAENEVGELYILDYGGQLIHITQSPIVTSTFNSNPTADGYIIETNETSGLGGALNTSYGFVTVGDSPSDQQIKSILSFNTSSLPDGAVITYARLSIAFASMMGSNQFGILGQLVTDVGNPIFGNSLALQNSDFQAAAGANSVATFSSTPISNWYSAGITSAGLSKISLTGNTQFRLRFTLDDNDNLISNRVNFYSGNAATGKPQLIVNYYMP